MSKSISCLKISLRNLQGKQECANPSYIYSVFVLEMKSTICFQRLQNVTRITERKSVQTCKENISSEHFLTIANANTCACVQLQP